MSLLPKSERKKLSTITETEFYWHRLQMPDQDKYDYSVERHCITCKRGNARKILNCRATWCRLVDHAGRYQQTAKPQAEALEMQQLLEPALPTDTLQTTAEPIEE
jgi:hypothetical protein